MKRKNRTNVSQEVKQTKWDVIAIGSGLTALSAAVTLAQMGKKVLMLEQHYIPGGYATKFKRKGFTFEVSLHQTLALNEGGYMNQILSHLGVMNKIQPIRLSSTLKLQTCFGDLYVGPDYLAQLKRIFPKEAKNIEKLDKLIDNVLSQSVRAMALASLPKWLSRPLAKIFTPTIYRIYRKTLTDILDSYFSDSRLKQLIAIQWGYYGLPQDRMSGLMYLLDWGGFLKRGIYYLKGTSQTLSNALVERLEELGGCLLLRQNVEEILIEDGSVVGVRSRRVRKSVCDEEYTFHAPVILSGANPFFTFEHLLDGKKHIPSYYWDKMSKLEPSASAICAYIGLDCRFERFSHDSHHSVGELDLDSLDINKLYEDTVSGQLTGFGDVIHHSAMDSSLAPFGKSVITTIRLEFNDSWKGLSEEEYQSKKAKLTQEIIGSLEQRFPGIREHIEVIEVATPRTMTRYTKNHNGAFNGFAFTLERVGMFDGGIPSKTPVRGLYFANAWAGAVGGGFSGSIPVGFKLGQTIARSMSRRS